MGRRLTTTAGTDRHSLAVGQRVVWIDVAKALGMFLVVWGHCVQNVMKFHDDDSMAVILLMRFIYSFHMPLFFIISGLTFNPHAELPYRAFVIKKAKGLIYPYFTLSLCAFPIWLVERSVGAVQPDSIRNIVLGTFYSNASVIRGIANAGWFMLTLFLAECLMGALARHANDIRDLVIMSMGVLLIGVGVTQYGLVRAMPWHIGVALICQFYVLVGHLARLKGFDAIDAWSGGRRALAGCLLTVFATLCMVTNTMVDYSNFYYGNIVNAIGSAVGYSLVTIMVVRSLCKVCGRLRLLPYIGRNTVIYLMLHVNVIRLIQHYWPVTELRIATATVTALALYAALLIPVFVLNTIAPALVRFPKRAKAGAVA